MEKNYVMGQEFPFGGDENFYNKVELVAAQHLVSGLKAT